LVVVVVELVILLVFRAVLGQEVVELVGIELVQT
jgi:hypothetical protein